MLNEYEFSEHANKLFIAKDENDNESAIYYNQVYAISITTNIIILILLFFAIITPWWVSRNESIKTIQYLVSERVSTSSKAFSNATEYFLRKYEIACIQLRGLSYDPNISRCSAKGALNFIRYSQTINSVLNPRPYRFYLAHNQSAGCQIEIDKDNTELFKLFMIIPYNQTHDQIKVFNQDTDFSPDRFKPESDNFGTLLRYVVLNDSIVMRMPYNHRMHDSPYWTSDISHFGDFGDNRTLTFLYPQLNSTDPTLSTVSGVVISNTVIFNFLNTLPSSSRTSWLILDDQGRTLIDKDLGPIYPTHINSYIPDFPSVDLSLNSLWRDASIYIKNLNEEIPLLITMNDLQYYLIKRPVCTYNGHLTFNSLMMICYDDLLLDVFRPINFLFIIVVILATLSIFLHRYLDSRNKKKRNKLLVPYTSISISKDYNKENSNFEYSENSIHKNNNDNTINQNTEEDSFELLFFNNGRIGKAISGLRELELTSPGEIMMNKIVDESINNFSRTRNRLFSICYTSKSSENCDLCKYLKGESYQQNESDELPNFQQPNFLLSQQKNPKPNQIYNAKNKTEIKFYPYKFMNLEFDSDITQNLLEEYLQDDFPDYLNNNANNSLNFNDSNYNTNIQDEPPFFTWNILTFNHFMPSFSSISTIDESNPNENVAKSDSNNNDSLTNVNNNDNNSDDNNNNNDNNHNDINDNNNNTNKNQNDRNDILIMNDDDILPINDEKSKIRKRIVYQFIEFIQDKKLVFLDIDPDQIVEFSLYFTNNFMKNPYKTYQNLKTLEYLFSTDFYQWINNKLDMFALLLCVFIRDIDFLTDEDILNYLNVERYKAELESEINEKDNNDNNSDVSNNNNNNSNQIFENSSENINIRTNQAIYDIFEMPIFDLNININTTDNNDSNISSYNESDNHNRNKSNLGINTRTSSSNDNNIKPAKKDIFTLNDSYSKKKRKIELFKYIFNKFISFSQRNFNHVYIYQRISRILEMCDITSHFETLCEFEDRAGSPDFSAVSHSEDIDIFMRSIFIFIDYSRFWCENDDFEIIFDEYNKKQFKEDELTNKKFVWSFQKEILIKIVAPFFELLTIFCPLDEMSEKINNVSILIQQKIENKINGPQPCNFIDNLADINDNDPNVSNEMLNNYVPEKISYTKSSETQMPNKLAYRKIPSSSDLSPYDDDDDANIEDGNGEDVDGD